MAEERIIIFTATLNDVTGDLNLTRQSTCKFTSVEMMGILESFKSVVLNEQLRNKIHEQEKTPTNKPRRKSKS